MRFWRRVDGSAAGELENAISAKRRATLSTSTAPKRVPKQLMFARSVYSISLSPLRRTPSTPLSVMSLLLMPM